MADYAGNLWKIKWQGFFAAFRIFVAIQYVYFQQNGLSFAEIGLVTGGFFAGMFTFEIPSGILADHYGRKTSIVISSILFIASFLLFGFGASLTTFLIANILQGAGEAFVSGSDESLIYDSLKEDGREDDFSKHFGGKWAYFMYGAGVSGLVTYLVSSFDVRVTFFLSIVGAAISLIFAAVLKEPPLEKRIERKDYFGHFRDSLKILFTRKALRNLFIFIVVTNFTTQIYFQYIQFMLKDIAVPVKYFGLVYAAFIIFSGVSSHTAHMTERWLGKKYALILIPLLSATALLAPWYGLSVATVGISILFVEFLFGYMWPVMNKHFHSYVESYNRATMSSIRSFTTGILILCLAPLLGQIADVQKYQSMFLYLGLLSLMITVPALIAFAKSDNQARVE